MKQKKIYPLSEIVREAKEKSIYYRELYNHCHTQGEIRIEQLPCVEQKKFWEYNSIQNNRVLTGPIDEGFVFRSGGTTGHPKFSLFTQEEWATFCSVFGEGLDRGGLKNGERVGNLFNGGDLYTSFLFIGRSIEAAEARAVIYPIMGSTPAPAVADLIRDFEITTLVGMPTTLIALTNYLENHSLSLPSVKRMLFGGESMYADQREFVRKVFPDITVRSTGYASVDAGLLGFVDDSCGPEEHRVFDEATILEIVDEETGEVINEPGRAGRVLITNLTRKLMPIIRYPAGDRAEWVEPQQAPCRKFKLLGRSEEASRVGPISLYYEDLRSIIDQVLNPLKATSPLGIAFQMIVTHQNGKDQLTIRIGVGNPKEVSAEKRALLDNTLKRERQLLREYEETGKILPTLYEWVQFQELETNPRTGKLKRVLDLRQSGI